MKFILVRHGETQWNTSRKFGGYTDVPLNDTGRSQAKVAGEKLKHEKIDQAYCSDLSRAVDTANAIMFYHDLTTKYDAEIREMNFGALGRLNL